MQHTVRPLVLPGSRASLLALAAFVLVAGCGPASQPATGVAGDAYFPMVAGARWLYSLRSDLGRLEVEVTARGEMPLPGAGGAVFVMDERNLGPDLGFAETAPVGYVVEEGYVARIAGLGYDASGHLRLLGQDQPTRILPLEPTPGHRWGQETQLFRTPDGGGARLGWTGEVKTLTPLSVPAGRFEEVVELETLYRDASQGEIAVNVIYRDYYARGVGLVRSVTEDPSGDPAHRIEQVLLEYDFPR